MQKRVYIAILAMGFSGVVAQILLLREMLIVFSGNELSIGIILSHWLILEAIGAFFLGRITAKYKHQLETFTIITILFFISLFIAIFLIRALKEAIGISIGESIGFLPMFYLSFLILLPASILHGALFTSSCRIYSMFSNQEASLAGRVYAHETVGTVIGGIACTYLLFIPYFNTFQTFSWLALLNLIICLALLVPYWKTGPVQKTMLVILSVLVFFSGYLIFAGQANKLHYDSIQSQWRNLNVVHYQNSPYGNICVIENEGQYIFFQDGIPNIITPVPDILSVKKFVHLPLLAHPEPEKLLILSGGAGGVINEALKHPTIETIKYIELDPLLIELFGKFPTPLTESELGDRRVKIEHIDGRLWLATTQDKYDLIFMGAAEPSTLQVNRFFTQEFFSLAKARLNEGGILVFRLPGSLAYTTEGLKNLNSSIFHTAKSIFPYVRVLPGDGANIFLLSDSPAISIFDQMQITERLIQRNIQANVIIPWQIEQKLHPGWQVWFSNFIEGVSQKINSDLNPIGVFYSISHWNALFAPSLNWLFIEIERISLWTGVLLLIAFLIYFVFCSKKLGPFKAGISLSIITTGFAGMIFYLMLIFAFQSIYGYVFAWIGLLVASFMAGAACGAMLIAIALKRIKNSLKFFAKIEVAIMCFSIGCPGIVFAVHAYIDNPEVFFFSKWLFLGMSFVGGLLIGSQFPIANKLYLKHAKTKYDTISNSANLSKAAGSLYASDLIGGWLGGIIGAVILLPVLGLIGTGITVVLLKLTSFIVIAAQLNRQL
jgi:spermidine synthase